MTEPYIVVCGKTGVFTHDQLTAWVESYCVEYSDHTDMHQLFADKLNITRTDAKQLAHKIAWKYSIGLGNLGHYIGRN